MPRNERPKQIPEGQKEAADPTPEVEPKVTDGSKGDPASRLGASEEPAENEEKQRVREKLEKRDS